MKKLTILLLVLATLTSCKVSVQHGDDVTSENNSVNTEALKSVLYMQTAAEYRALCYQTFNFGKVRLDNYLKRMNMSKKYAIVVDIDETVLDNSPHAAQSLIDGTNYPTGWSEWITKAEAKPIPGALEFLNYADENGIDVFYISNRKEELKDATIVNLQEVGFPNVSNETVMLRTTTSGKEPRRDVVKETHEIIMLFGDNLADFLPVFEKKPIADRFGLVDKYEKEFGAKFFVLPNPSYGDWEGAIYDFDYSLSEQEKFSAKAKSLKGFKE
jgi:5'-nucleotidase (lipoprotein e(P4) family)